MGCMCMDCKYNDIVRDNHDELHPICTCVESENFLKPVSYVWTECDAGEVEMEDEDAE